MVFLKRGKTGMKKFLWGVVLAAWLGGSMAQAPSAPAAGSVSPGGASSAIIDQEKRGNAPVQQQTTRTTNARPGAAPLPMNVRIQGEGIKMPSCTAESREGEACKK
jgi:hypothetical protein